MSRTFQKYSLYELVIMAVIAALGIALKPIISPLAHIVCGPLMIPSGTLAGGLYMMWIVIGYGLVRKPGTALIICLIQALLVIFTGVIGSHGIVSLVTYLLPGVLVEIVMLVSRHRGCCIGCCAAGGMAANMAGTVATNVVFFQVPGIYLILILSLSAVSGLIGGIIAWELIRVFEGFTERSLKGRNKWLDSIPSEKAEAEENTADENPVDKKQKSRRQGSIIAIVAATLVLVAGLTAYVNIKTVPEQGAGTDLTLNVCGETTTLSLADLQIMEHDRVKVKQSSASHEDIDGTYTGVMLDVILREKQIVPDETDDCDVILTAGDGYSTAGKGSEISDIMIIYVKEENWLQAMFVKDRFGNRGCRELTKITIE